MKRDELLKLSDEELLVKKKELNKSKITHAVLIGFMAGVLIFGVVSWAISKEKKVGLFIPLFFPAYFIYKTVKNSNVNKDLEDVLKERNL